MKSESGRGGRTKNKNGRGNSPMRKNFKYGRRKKRSGNERRLVGWRKRSATNKSPHNEMSPTVEQKELSKTCV